MKFWKENWPKIVSIALASGGSIIALFQKLIPILSKPINITIGSTIAVLMILTSIALFGYLLYKKGKLNRKFAVGDRVILKTERAPEFVVTGYNTFNNKVKCECTFKEQFVIKEYPQDALKIYEPYEPVLPQRQRRSNYW